MLLPKITYNNGTLQTLNVTFPPVNKPLAEERDAQRTDTATLSGRVQSLTFRVDKYFDLEWNFVPAADIAGWEAFIDYAILGNPFSYYPDATSGTHIDYILADTNWKPEFSSRGMSGIQKFKVRFRRQVL